MLQNIKSKLSRVHRIDRFFFLILIICSIPVIANIKDFGASWDEPMLYDYASYLPEIYESGARGIVFDDYDRFYDLKYYGPAYLAAGVFPAGMLAVFPQYDTIDAWHILNFIVFLMGVVCLYWVCQKYAGKPAAMLSAVMYLSQPLLLGHGVLNPKDTPFASFFLLTIALGVKMIEASQDERNQSSNLLGRINPWLKKWYVWVIILLFGLILVDRANDNFLISAIISALPGMKLSGSAHTQQMINHRHEYMREIITDINSISALLLVLVLLVALFFFFKNSSRFQRSVFWAGLALGLTASIRVLGPAAGAMVLFMWMLVEKPKKIIIPALVYAAIALLVMYLTWPFLWKDTVPRLIESFQIMSRFPWKGSVLFDGSYYSPGSLRWFYLFKLIAIQISIPALMVFFIGCGILTLRIIKDRRLDYHLSLPFIWFFAPLCAWVLIRPNAYDNFRQFLFIIPAMFIFAAVGIGFLIDHFRQNVAMAGIVLAAILPGLLSNIYLHPFQYVYYNALVGWTSNIHERYEADYWATSMCQAGRYLDEVVDDQTTIYLITEIHALLFQRCIQHSPQFVFDGDPAPTDFPDYAVILNRWGAADYFFQDMQTIHSISIGNTPLVIIKKAP